MRLRVRRRKTLNLFLKIIFAVLVIIFIYFYTSKKSQLQEIKQKTDSRTKIIIVENENDAITVWDNLIKENNISISFGTIVSISSHFNDGFYFLQNLKKQEYVSVDQLFNLVKQVNLQTISLALTGFFNKVIWIYPMWIPNSDIFSLSNQYVGINNDNLCICSFFKNRSSSNKTLCENLFPLFTSPVNEDDCQLLNNNWEMLSMQEIYAMVSLNHIGIPAPILVNINLDFFTAEQPKSLLIYGSVRNKIEKHLNSIFCVQSTSEELIIDEWFNKVVQHLHILDIVQLKKVVGLPVKSLCKTMSSFITDTIQSLLTELRTLTQAQLKQLSTIGVCIAEISHLDQSNPFHKLHICTGLIYSNESVSHIKHSCADVEFNLQMEKIIQVLQNGVARPMFISIIRSSRIGVVSPRNQYYLESVLLTKLQSIYKLNSSDVFYDTGLLGGANGWWFRHHK